MADGIIDPDEDPMPLYIVVRDDRAAYSSWAQDVFWAQRSMKHEAANAIDAATPVFRVLAKSEGALRLIIAEAVIRDDWVSIHSAGDEPLCAIVGPTTGAGPVLLAAEITHG